MTWIELDGAVNVRDLGGLPTRDGGSTAAARLLRADNLQELSQADVARLVRGLGLTTVVDLRSAKELRLEGPAPLDTVPGVRHAHHPVLAELGMHTGVITDALHGQAQRDEQRYPADPVTGHYLGYLEERPDQVVAAVRSIARSDGAALVHCAAGKDRTGVVVALALVAVGVRAQAVIEDYGASGDRAEAIVASLRRSPAYAADVASKPAESYRVRPETMAAFLEQMEARHGGVGRWLAEHGFRDLSRLRARLLRQDA